MELKPCPFCGGEDIHVGWTDFDSGVIFMECGTCGMYCEPKDCYENEPKAIEAWNTRAERTCHIVDAYCSECGKPDPSSGDAEYCAYCGARVVGA